MRDCQHRRNPSALNMHVGARLCALVQEGANFQPPAYPFHNRRNHVCRPSVQRPVPKRRLMTATHRRLDVDQPPVVDSGNQQHNAGASLVYQCYYDHSFVLLLDRQNHTYQILS